MIALPRLDFGAPAAERDIARGLKTYFVESPSYRRLKAGQTTVLLGNRGTGKSAICKMLGAEPHGPICVELSPEDYSYEVLSKNMAKEHEGSWAKAGAYAAAWKYLIYVLIMAHLLERRPSLANTKHGKPVFRYLRDHHEGFQKTKLDVLVSYLKRLEGIKVGPYEATLKAKQLENLYKLESLQPVLPSLVHLCEDNPVRVIVDELDKGWDASEDAKSFVAGLFQAAVGLNQSTPGIRVIVSLRKELYDNIPALYEDAQKVWDIIETVEWNEASLRDLIAKRIGHSFNELERVPAAEQWAAVFEQSPGYGDVSSYDYMLARTLYRPREMIQFCTQAKDHAIEAERNTILYENVAHVEGLYSEQRAKDIAAEYRFEWPGLLSVFNAFGGGPAEFTRQSLEDICLGIILKELKRSPETCGWLDNQEPEYLIELLWKVGFLMVMSSEVKAGRTRREFVGSHQVRALNLQNKTDFSIHQMFRAYLGVG